MSENIILTPSNWLYNAGVVGFLRILSSGWKEFEITKNGEIEISVGLLKKILEATEDFKEKAKEYLTRKDSESWKNCVPDWHFYYISEGILDNQPHKKESKEEEKDKKYLILEKADENITFNSKRDIEKDASLPDDFKKFIISYREYTRTLFAKGCIYQNQYAPANLKNFNKFIDEFPPLKREINSNSLNITESECNFCHSNKYKTLPLDGKLMNLLMPSLSGFPNSFWNNRVEGIDKICTFCQFLLIHHHLALTRLSDGSEIFINAPSFKLMYELNKLVRELFGKTEADSTKKREILAMSVIEYTRRLQTTLGQWNAMNIEIIVKKKDMIDFYTLPYETVNIISDRTIASILSDLGEFFILGCVISEDYSLLQEISHKIIRASFKNESISAFIKVYKNQNNPILTAQKILKLYAKIIDRRKQYARAK